ncbi:MAG: hypothetical protein LKK36_09325 [Ewingella americana]|jgi:hypothetical protein|uniref:hypothetical protein n=1 Tax=Ewingella americana TaxID=41202 RepID=UPI002430E62E|nr:hypothetical protein [Ewingella americana]MCI1680465.1 hypothetical protein [Ewingella americana]MCI1856315.1 hypothetical protein [Ewingella americana]MCI1863968.1 hypothetical protein [Ewingella americana]MCI2142994.1 hypothetical protein [Ewingella americana]MCI2163879.1 hypothetical protein [Ewingella americana]
MRKPISFTGDAHEALAFAEQSEAVLTVWMESRPDDHSMAMIGALMAINNQVLGAIRAVMACEQGKGAK